MLSRVLIAPVQQLPCKCYLGVPNGPHPFSLLMMCSRAWHCRGLLAECCLQSSGRICEMMQDMRNT